MPQKEALNNSETKIPNVQEIMDANNGSPEDRNRLENITKVSRQEGSIKRTLKEQERLRNLRSSYGFSESNAYLFTGALTIVSVIGLGVSAGENLSELATVALGISILFSAILPQKRRAKRS